MKTPGKLVAIRKLDRRWWLGFSLYILFAIVARVEYAGPRVGELKQPAHDRQADLGKRCIETLAHLLGPEQTVHPAGSQANAEFREKLIANLEAIGLEVERVPFIDDGVELTNLIARLPGKPAARPIVLSTHYDSCSFGPGAGDAGVCVAAFVEAARELVRQPNEHEIWFIFTDGEELGLRGAQLMVAAKQYPWNSADSDSAPVSNSPLENTPAADKKSPFVVSFDARGNRDCAALYETDRNNYRSMLLAANHLPRPLVTSSLMVNVYERLPNGTDFTVYKEAGWSGWNFALIGGAEFYHHPEDKWENLSLASAQHFAENALAAAQLLDGLSDRELLALSDSQPATFFDMLGRYVMVYPAWCDWLLLAIAAGLAGLAFRRAGGSIWMLMPLWQLGVGTLLMAGIGFGVSLALQSGGLLPRPFVAGGELIAQVYLVLAAIGLTLYGKLKLTTVRLDACLAMLSVGSLLGAALMLWVAPGGAYLALWPSLWLSALAIVGHRLSAPVATLLVCLLPAALFAPTYVLLVRAMGPTAGAMLAAASSLMLMPTLVAFVQHARSEPSPAVTAAI